MAYNVNREKYRNHKGTVLQLLVHLRTFHEAVYGCVLLIFKKSPVLEVRIVVALAGSGLRKGNRASGFWNVLDLDGSYTDVSLLCSYKFFID